MKSEALEKELNDKSAEWSRAGMRRHRLEFTASPMRAELMGSNFVKARRPRTSVP
jgi:hypothetical protein